MSTSVSTPDVVASNSCAYVSTTAVVSGADSTLGARAGFGSVVSFLTLNAAHEQPLFPPVVKDEYFASLLTSAPPILIMLFTSRTTMGLFLGGSCAEKNRDNRLS